MTPPETSVVVVGLHASGSSPSQMANKTRFAEFADGQDSGRVTVVFPEGTGGTWNAGGCCRGKTDDDVGYLDSVLQPYVDSGARVALFDQSNGGMMALRYWYQGTHRVHALGTQSASLSTSGGDFSIGDWQFPYPAHWIHWHGLADDVVPFSGRAGCGDQDRARLSEFVPVPALIDMARTPASAGVKGWKDRGSRGGVITVYRTRAEARHDGDWRLRVRLLPGVGHDNRLNRWPASRYSFPFRFLVKRSLSA